jgi:hypothetical protein
MSREFTEKHVRALCLLAGIEVVKVWQQDNQYWPAAYVEARQRSPWFLVKTKAGMVQIGWRKRVLSIDWDDTPIRMVVTQDDTTKDDAMVHAWSYEKAVEYLGRLAADIDRHAAEAAPKDGVGVGGGGQGKEGGS